MCEALGAGITVVMGVFIVCGVVIMARVTRATPDLQHKPLRRIPTRDK